jgi:endonuclease/exonuclease/phosphatase family metal-dependent hydrolase
MAVRKARAGSGAAQHAWKQGGAAQHASKQGGAAQHAFETKCGDASELTVAFYNVGIQMAEIGAKKWEAKERRLAADIVKAIKVHELDILCLSELGQVGVGIGKKFPEGGVVGWLKNLLADKNVSPVDIYADGHYATIVLSGRVDVLQYQVIKDFHEQADRSFQHFRLRTSQRGQVISLINCHAPSAKPNRILTVQGRVQYFKAFHKASAGDPFIWGGDFNTKPVQFATLLGASMIATSWMHSLVHCKSCSPIRSDCCTAT